MKKITIIWSIVGLASIALLNCHRHVVRRPHRHHHAYQWGPKLHRCCLPKYRWRDFHGAARCNIDRQPYKPTKWYYCADADRVIEDLFEGPSNTLTIDDIMSKFDVTPEEVQDMSFADVVEILGVDEPTTEAIIESFKDVNGIE